MFEEWFVLFDVSLFHFNSVLFHKLFLFICIFNICLVGLFLIDWYHFDRNSQPYMLFSQKHKNLLVQINIFNIFEKYNRTVWTTRKHVSTFKLWNTETRKGRSTICIIAGDISLTVPFSSNLELVSRIGFQKDKPRWRARVVFYFRICHNGALFRSVLCQNSIHFTILGITIRFNQIFPCHMQCPGKCIQPGSWGGEYPRSLVISVSEISFYGVVDEGRSFGQRGKVVRIIGVKCNRSPRFCALGGSTAAYTSKKTLKNDLKKKRNNFIML